jgi:hypothetical protein
MQCLPAMLLASVNAVAPIEQHCERDADQRPRDKEGDDFEGEDHGVLHPANSASTDPVTHFGIGCDSMSNTA